MTRSHAANLLGALALALTDRTFDAVAAAGESGTAAVALSARYQFFDRPTSICCGACSGSPIS